MRFVAIDVETANPDMTSICSVGLAIFESGMLAEEWYSLVNPKSYFDPLNSSIHGISEKDVLDAPVFGALADRLSQFLQNGPIVSHTHFDRVSVHKAFLRSNITMPECIWYDSACVARRTWEECSKSGYRLKDVCKLIGYEFQHHNALEDAKAAGQVMLAAMQKTGMDLDSIGLRLKQGINPSSGEPIRRQGSADGPLAGEVLVFTGALEIPRQEAANLAATVGCNVASSVTKKTTLLVVGDVDIQKLAGHEKSSKHRKAEELIQSGVPIRILGESDFKQLVSMA